MKKRQNNKKNSINFLYKIIIQNNIKFGRSQNLVSRNSNLFVFQTKNNIEFFHIIDIKNALYKIFLYIKTAYVSTQKQSNLLFASTTSVYSEFIKSAALQANTGYHIDRWTSGTITRKINHWKKNNHTNIIYSKKKNIFNFCFFFNRYQKILRDSLTPTNNLMGLFIPDIQNNLMIIKEAKIQNIPLIGITNSNNFLEVDYPIFGNNKALFAVFFFSNLIANWIITHLRLYQEKKSFLYVQKRKKKKEKKKKNIKYLTKLNYYLLFKKRYVYMFYKFRKSISKELSYYVFMEKFDNPHIHDYKKKLKLQQQKVKVIINDLLFSSKKNRTLTTRLDLFLQSIYNNMVGGISFTNNFFGQQFWLYFRKFLNNNEKKKRYKFLYSFKWIIKRNKINWKWLKFGKKNLLNKNKNKKIVKKNIWGYRKTKQNINKNKWKKWGTHLNLRSLKSYEKKKYNKPITKQPNKKNTSFFKHKF